jgi:hypothetical protein
LSEAIAAARTGGVSSMGIENISCDEPTCLHRVHASDEREDQDLRTSTATLSRCEVCGKRSNICMRAMV